MNEISQELSPSNKVDRRSAIGTIAKLLVGGGMVVTGLAASPTAASAAPPDGPRPPATPTPEVASAPECLVPVDLQDVVTKKLLEHYHFYTERKLPLKSFNHGAEVASAITEYYLAKMGDDFNADEFHKVLNQSFDAYFHALDRIKDKLMDELGLSGVFLMPDTIGASVQTGSHKESLEINNTVPVMTFVGLYYESLPLNSVDKKGDVIEHDGVVWADPLLSIGLHP